MAEEEYKFERRGLGKKRTLSTVLRDEGEVRAEGFSALSALFWEEFRRAPSFTYVAAAHCQSHKLSFRCQAPSCSRFHLEMDLHA